TPQRPLSSINNLLRKSEHENYLPENRMVSISHQSGGCVKMKMNRRKALIGIGSLAVGSGAALGSGAFTSVRAQRNVDVTVASGDSSAALGLSSSSNYVSSSGSTGVLSINIGSGGVPLNDDAITRINGVFSIENNAPDGNDRTVSFFDTSSTVSGLNNNDGNGAGSSSIVVEVSSSSPKAEVELTLSGSSSNGATVTSGSPQPVDAEIRTGTETTSGLSNAPEDLIVVGEDNP
ncbi:MAG: hypothetical protein ABEJ26_07310, partial [Halosimplex sp.]